MFKVLEVQSHISLQPYNTFGIPVDAARFAIVRSVSEVQSLIKDGSLKEKHLFLGGGSNVLFTADFDGLVIKNEIKGISVVREDNEFVWVQAASGEVWHDLVLYAVEHNWGGIENLSLIPGTVGAAPMQNIGAYGVELTHVFESLKAIDIRTGGEKPFLHSDCSFGYRESVFKHAEKGNYFIASVTLRLNKSPKLHVQYGAIQDVLRDSGVEQPTIQDVSRAVIQIRTSKLPDPKILGNAGSFFKNPEISADLYATLKEQFSDLLGYPASEGKIKVPAGYLIEKCGWKGKIVGNTGAHKNQALVLVNYGNATGIEIMQLARDIQSSVLATFGITIVPEVNLI